MHPARVAVSFGAAVTLLAMTACVDPEKAAIELFQKQGITLLMPARDYIKVGGLVSKKGNDLARFDDPFDTIPALGVVPINTIIMSQAKNQKTSFGVLTSKLGQLVSLPIGLKVDSALTFELAQTSARGSRLESKPLRGLLNPKTETAQQAKSYLQDKARVFLVQDVYSGKSLSVKTDRSGGFQATLGGKELGDCSAKKPENATKPETTAKPDAKTPAEAKPSTPSAGATTAPPQTTPATAELPSLSVSACKQGNFALQFSSDSDIPFGVRLVELALDKTGNLVLKPGVPKLGGILGPDPGTSPSFVDDSAVVRAFTYQPRQKR